MSSSTAMMMEGLCFFVENDVFRKVLNGKGISVATAEGEKTLRFACPFCNVAQAPAGGKAEYFLPSDAHVFGLYRCSCCGEKSSSELARWECLDFCVQGGFQGGSQSRLSFVYRGLKINDQRLRGTLSRRQKCVKRHAEGSIIPCIIPSRW